MVENDLAAHRFSIRSRMTEVPLAIPWSVVEFGMKLADIWTVAGGPEYAGKPRPAVIIQDDAFAETASITVCPFTTHLVDAPLIRLSIDPTRQNGLNVASQVMVDKITTVAKSKLKKHVGELADEDMIRVNRAVLVFLGLAGRS